MVARPCARVSIALAIQGDVLAWQGAVVWQGKVLVSWIVNQAAGSFSLEEVLHLID